MKKTARWQQTWRWCLMMALGGLMAGCWSTPFLYLGVPEDDGRIMEQVGANGQRQFIRITPVRATMMSRYETYKSAGMVENEQSNENFLYYSISVPISNPVSEGQSAGYRLERYKVRLDDSVSRK